MATPPTTTAMPSVDNLVGEVVATLSYAAYAYMDPPEGSDAAADLDAAEIAIDLAGKAFERIEPRLTTEQRSSLAGLLTDLRMTYVRKRGA